MNLWVRALLGALAGACITLAIHPLSRQFLFGVLHLSSPKSIAGIANIHPAVLPPPTTTEDAAYWLQIASDKLAQGGKLTDKELRTLTSIGTEGAKLERENAFWPQMLAVLLAESNRQSEARDQWMRASHCQSWNDLQTKRLLEDRKRLAEGGDWNQAWTYGYVYFARSEAPAELIESYAKKLVSKCTTDDLDGLKLRYSTICNGSLLRDGSRSIKVGKHGASIVEISTYPPALSDLKGVRRLWIAKTATVARLRESRLLDEAAFAERCFQSNEAWLVYMQDQNSEENLRNICLAAIGLSTLPGSLMLCAVFGALILGAVKLSERWTSLPDRFSPKIVIPIGVLCASLAYWATRLWPLSLTIGASVCYLVVGPRFPRTLKLKELGPLFSFSLLCVWLISCVGLTTYFVSTSTAASALLPLLGPTGEYLTDSRLFLAVSLAMASLIFLIVPTWAVVRKQGTPNVFSAAMREFGLYLCIGSLILCAVAGPLSVYGDKRFSTELEQIVSNEPIYYQPSSF